MGTRLHLASNTIDIRAHTWNASRTNDGLNAEFPALASSPLKIKEKKPADFGKTNGGLRLHLMQSRGLYMCAFNLIILRSFNLFVNGKPQTSFLCARQIVQKHCETHFLCGSVRDNLFWFNAAAKEGSLCLFQTRFYCFNSQIRQ